MRLVRCIQDLQLDRNLRLGLVPTMGAFHAGHVRLMERARSECDFVAVTLFVNPLQFGANEDLSRYPRQEESDASMAERAGVDLLFAPPLEELIPRTSTVVQVPEVGDLWEGVHRPGHFNGVATIVAKLFNLFDPAVAYFGLKDYQQCMVIRRMVEDLNMRVQLEWVPTMREADGLAMSSRNAYLSPELRKIAPRLHATLKEVAFAIRDRGATTVLVALDSGKRALTEAGFVVEYLALVDDSTLLPLEHWDGQGRLMVAAKLGPTRLIDNIEVG